MFGAKGCMTGQGKSSDRLSIEPQIIGGRHGDVRWTLTVGDVLGDLRDIHVGSRMGAVEQYRDGPNQIVPVERRRADVKGDNLFDPQSAARVDGAKAFVAGTVFFKRPGDR